MRPFTSTHAPSFIVIYAADRACAICFSRFDDFIVVTLIVKFDRQFGAAIQWAHLANPLAVETMFSLDTFGIFRFGTL